MLKVPGKSCFDVKEGNYKGPEAKKVQCRSVQIRDCLTYLKPLRLRWK